MTHSRHARFRALFVLSLAVAAACASSNVGSSDSGGNPSRGGAGGGSNDGGGGRSTAAPADTSGTPTHGDASDLRPDADGKPPGPQPAVGERFSLQPALRARWMGTRRSSTVENGTVIMTGAFIANTFGGPNGHSVRLAVKPGRDYILEYKIRFDGAFDWSLGGKIPGLAGGDAPSGCISTTGLGFSARMMWRQNGKLIGYVYDNDQSNPCGTAIDASNYSFTANKWFAVKERVKLNTGTANNGTMQVWIDGAQVINRSNFAFMNEGADRRIDQVMFQAFYGGSTSNWAPSRNTTISFADVFVTLLAE